MENVIVSDVANMNPKVGLMWAEALESGEYEQGRGLLTERFPDGVERDCCLGVLCKLAIKAGVKVEVEVRPTSDDDDAGEGGSRLEYDLNFGVPPESVARWAGLRPTQDPTIAVPRPIGANLTTCTELNDNREWTFTQIAAAIRENLKKEESDG